MTPEKNGGNNHGQIYHGQFLELFPLLAMPNVSNGCRSAWPFRNTKTADKSDKRNPFREISGKKNISSHYRQSLDRFDPFQIGGLSNVTEISIAPEVTMIQHDPTVDSIPPNSLMSNIIKDSYCMLSYVLSSYVYCILFM